jgi:hypothetical protein
MSANAISGIKAAITPPVPGAEEGPDGPGGGSGGQKKVNFPGGAGRSTPEGAGSQLDAQF